MDVCTFDAYTSVRVQCVSVCAVVPIVLVDRASFPVTPVNHTAEQLRLLTPSAAQAYKSARHERKKQPVSDLATASQGLQVRAEARLALGWLGLPGTGAAAR